MANPKASTNVSWSGLSFVYNNSKNLVVLSATPANLAACTAATVIARKAITSANMTTLSSDATGKFITVASFATVDVIATGAATCIALYNTAAGSGTTGIHYWTKCSLTVPSTPAALNIQSWKITIADPTTDA